MLKYVKIKRSATLCLNTVGFQNISDIRGILILRLAGIYKTEVNQRDGSSDSLNDELQGTDHNYHK